MFTITTFGLSKLNNAEITGYYLNFQKAVNEEDAETCGFDTALFTQYRNVLKKLIDQTYSATGSEKTAKMQQFDSKRDQIYRRILLRLQMVEFAEENTKLIAVKEIVMKQILAKYGVKVTSMPMHEETAVIEGFCHDCKTKLTERQLEDLGISDDLDSLLAANASFLTAYSDRSFERAEGDTQLTLKLRAELTEIYQRLVIVAQYYANSTAEADATKATACQGLISVVNVMIDEVQKRYAARTSKASSSDTPAGGNDQPAGGNTPAGGNDQPAGGNTPAGGNDQPAGGNDTPASTTPTSLGVTENSDGSTTERFSDGSYIVRFADGTYLTVDKDGEKVMHY